MGIKGLSAFLKKYPELFERIHISEYAYKKVAIDTSLYMCAYKANFGEGAWLSAFIKLVSILREFHVHPVFVYDTSSPPEKQAEKEDRKNNRNKMDDRVFLLEEAIERFHTDGTVDPILLKFQEKRKIQTSLLRQGQNVLNINAIESAVKKMRKQLFSITPEDFETTRKLFTILDIPYMLAPMEAETLCSDLCLQKKVDAVISEDTDVLAYQAEEFLTKINTKDATCTRIRYSAVLEALKLTPEMWVDFIILCGTDYNKNIPNVGPVKAYKLILEHKSIENIAEKTNLDVSILNHVRGRELFLDYKKCDSDVPYCGAPDFPGLGVFIAQKNIRTNMDYLKKAFVHNTIVFEEEPESEEEIIML